MCNNKVSLSMDDVIKIFQSRSAKMVGIIMKRFEAIENRDDLKRVVKELIHEQLREIRDLILENKTIFYSNYKDETDK